MLKCKFICLQSAYKCGEKKVVYHFFRFFGFVLEKKRFKELFTTGFFVTFVMFTKGLFNIKNVFTLAFW